MSNENYEKLRSVYELNVEALQKCVRQITHLEEMNQLLEVGNNYYRENSETEHWLGDVARETKLKVDKLKKDYASEMERLFKNK